MTENPTRAIRLYGTEESVDPPRLLRTARLTAEFEAGNLRYIRFGGTEVLRAISYIVRDKDWGTYNPSISNLEIDESPERFLVNYRAEARDPEQHFAYDARIVGHADGRLVFSAEGEAASDFTTNRTGFVILHAADLAGTPAEIEHVDGRTVTAEFPRLIDPVQPMMELRALTHRAGGLGVTTRMEGDTFEMEDQRNWTDASYKSYVRPLARPWPYMLERGTRLSQSVTVAIEGTPAAAAGDGPVHIALGAASGTMPAIGMGLDPDDAAPTLDHAETLRQLGLRHLICRHDPRRGHDRDTLAACVEAARALGAEPWLEAVIASIEGFEGEVASLGAAVRDLGSPFATVLVSPAPDLKCTLPGGVWPETPPAEALYAAARRAFPGARLGGGMFSYFTELNRKRPPEGTLDLVSFTTSGVVHAGDDRSVMETILALPAIAASTRAIAAGTPFAAGPSAIGMRENPYGAAPKANPGNVRQAMSFNDPRQRGLFGAAWSLGYVAALAEGGASAVALGAPVGAFGTISTPQPLPQPWFEGKGGLHPVFHVIRGLAALEGAPIRSVTVNRPERVAAIAVDGPEGIELWAANLGAETVVLDIEPEAVAVLDASRFVEAAEAADLLGRLSPADAPNVPLDAYGVARMLLRA
ncbi:hypothetical protein BH23PSE1_BH23PSE1_04360 [soil metagenome]